MAEGGKGTIWQQVCLIDTSMAKEVRQASMVINNNMAIPQRS
jgi:hypothetical protein